MTLDEIRNSTKEVLTPAEVSEVLGCDPQDVRVAARRRPDLLGFHVCVLGSRVKIPRRAFLNWLEGGCESGNAG
jgi:hypothetical protein